MKPYNYKTEYLINDYGYIYMTVNNITNKAYIGRRGQIVASKDKSYLGSSVYLRDDIKEFGRENFSKYIITEGYYTDKLLGELEKHYIRLYNADNSDMFYNKSPGGDYDLKTAQINSKIKSSHPVFIINVNGEVLTEYNSKKECFRETGITERMIVKYIKTGRFVKSINAYISDTSVKPESEKEIIIFGKKIYSLYDNNFNKIADFKSVNAAARYLNCSVPALHSAYKNKGWVRKEYCLISDGIFPDLPYRGRPVIVDNLVDKIEYPSISKAAEFFKQKYNLQGNVASSIIKFIKNKQPYKSCYITYKEDEE